MKKLFPAALVLLLAACSETIPDYGAGPFRGTLFDLGTLDPLPVRPSDLDKNIEVAVSAGPIEVASEPIASAPDEAVTIPAEEEAVQVAAAEPEPVVVEPTPEPAEVPVPAEPDPNEEVQILNFDDMADFDYTAPTLDEIDNGTKRPEQIPAELLAYDNTLVEIEGYMIPIEVEDGKVQSFILSRTLSGCCFGDMPNIQEWVDVKMQEGTSADYIPYAPVLVIGRISIGETVDEYGITSLYRMTAESVEDPW